MKVMCLQACVCPRGEGICLSACWDTPQEGDPPPPWEQTPPEQTTPPGQGDPPGKETPPGSRHPARRHPHPPGRRRPPEIRPLLQTVCIPLECILVDLLDYLNF